jgi:predicted ribosome quality control (RQC) complex YloA/Tae2 family protein
MLLAEFTTQFNSKNTIILLEGKRNVLEQDKEKLIQFGNFLATHLPLVTFRSGNATGADYYFSKGVLQVAPERLQVITPYENHRQKLNDAYETISLDQIDLVNEEKIIYESKSNKKTKSLIDKYVGGSRDRFSIKAAYIIRDTIKVIGTKSGVSPIDFAFFYDDFENPKTGGTGHTMTVCEMNNIPYLTQEVWSKWF